MSETKSSVPVEGNLRPSEGVRGHVSTVCLSVCLKVTTVILAWKDGGAKR